MARKYNEARKRANTKYDTEKVDHIHLRLPKGKRSVIEKHIENTADNSVNGFVNRAIDEAIERDNRTD